MAPPPARHRGNLATLDLVRGGAALYVAAYHCVGALTASGLAFDTEGGSARLLRQGNLLAVAGFGFYAVLAFFVLSGFVIHLRLAERPEEATARGRAGWLAGYGWRRALRVYPPLVGALLLTAGLTALGHRLFAGWPWPQGNLTDARNVLLPLYGSATFGNGGALWSLAFEVWFYVAYAAVAVLLLGRPGRHPMGVVLAGSVVTAAVLLLVRAQAPGLIPASVDGLVTIAVYFPAWAAGAFLAELHAAGVRLLRRGPTLAAAALLVLVAAPHSGNQLRPAVDVLWGTAFALLIAALTLGAERDWVSRPEGRWAASTATWSYSLYLVHLPVIYLAQAGFGYDGAERVTNPFVVVAILLIALAAGWLFALAVERPTRRLASRSSPRSSDHRHRTPEPS